VYPDYLFFFFLEPVDLAPELLLEEELFFEEELDFDGEPADLEEALF
jgi:hypothetical protein